MSSIIKDLIEKKDLDKHSCELLMSTILKGQANDAQIAAAITLLRAKGETAKELAYLVDTMLLHTPDIGAVNSSDAIDTCGTGGDNSGSINISTACSIVLASADIDVAKHGNRAASSQCGAGDVLEELGVAIDLSPQQCALMFKETRYSFLFAPTFHAGMRHCVKVRKELGVRTTFNFLGPLANPYRAPYRLHGVSDPSIVRTYADALVELGVERGYVFHGAGGIDELSLSGPNKGIFINKNETSELVLDAVDYGFERSENNELEGGNCERNAEIISGVFKGQIHGPYRDSIVFNSAVALDIISQISIEKSVEKINDLIDSGKVTDKLAEIVAYSQKVKTQNV